MKLNSR